VVDEKVEEEVVVVLLLLIIVSPLEWMDGYN